MTDSGRFRKPNAKYDGELVSDEVFTKAIKNYSKTSTKKVKESHCNILSDGLEPPTKNSNSKRGLRPVGESKKSKVPVAKPIPPTAKEKAIDDAEEILIVNAANRQQTRAAIAKKTLPLGAQEIPDLTTAVKRGVKDSSTLLLDWTSKQARVVGSLCKVYWDGEDTWYYARILNYDSFYDRHYIYYLLDSTAEWLTLDAECVFVADEMVLAKVTPASAPWPALRFWQSEKAKGLAKTINGYQKGGDYIEYFSEDNMKEYAFLTHKAFTPIRDEFMPKKPNKKFLGAMSEAKTEQNAMDQVIEIVMKAIKDSIFTQVHGDQWLGLRVRMATWRIATTVQHNTQSSDLVISHNTNSHSSSGSSSGHHHVATVYSIGTVTKYCPATDRLFVLFDEALLQPQWVTPMKGAFEVLFDNNNTTTVATEKSTSAVSDESAVAAVIPTSSSNGKIDLLALFNCAMCSVHGSVEHVKSGSMLQCVSCTLVVHQYCMPVATPPAPIATTGVGKGKGGLWTCWQCSVCFGCDKRLWETEMVRWCTRRIDPELGNDKSLLLCGECLFKYKYDKDFCSICCKLYKSDDTAVLLVGDMSEAANTHEDQQQGHSQDTQSIHDSDFDVSEDDGEVENGINEDDENEDENGTIEGEDMIQDEDDDAAPLLSGNDLLSSFIKSDSKKTKKVGNKRKRRSGGVYASKTNKKSKTAQSLKKNITATSTTTTAVERNASSSSTMRTSPRKMNNAVSSTGSSCGPTQMTSKQSHISEDDNMVQCHECNRWVHAKCEGIDKEQYDAMSAGTHPVWGDEYLCPLCRVRLGNAILNDLQLQDIYGMFAEPVTTAVAKTYFDVIRNPMDISTMRSKNTKGLYKSLQSLRQDFELMCLNAIVFNKTGDEYWLAARNFYDKVQQHFDTNPDNIRLTHISVYGFELKQLVKEYDAARLAEKHSMAEERRAAEWEELYNQKQQQQHRPNKRKSRGPLEGEVESLSGINVEDVTTNNNIAMEQTMSSADPLDKSVRKLAYRAKSENEMVSKHTNGYGESDHLNTATMGFPHTNSTDSVSASSNTSEMKPSLSISNMLPAALVAASSSTAMDAIDKENETNKLMATLDIQLPITLKTPPDPESFLSCAVCIQSGEDAFYTCAEDMCLLCGSAGSSAMFLFCIDCGEAMHSFCADAPLVTMSVAARATWRCMNCKICESCGEASETDESSLLYCDLCDRAYHLHCLDPPMMTVPTSKWYCACCVVCRVCSPADNDVVVGDDDSNISDMHSGSDTPSEQQLVVATLDQVSNTSETSHRKTWGFEADHCHYCHTKEEKARQEALLLQQQEEERQKQLELQRRKQMMLNIYLCNICRTDCSSGYLLCNHCGQNSHPACSPQMTTFWHRERCASDFVCQQCVSSKQLENKVTHVGSGDKALAILTAVSKIQRFRVTKSAKVVDNLVSVYTQSIHNHFEKHRHLLRAVLTWACLRVNFLETADIAQHVYLSGQKQHNDILMHLPIWSRYRGSRFCVVYRRRGRMTPAQFSAHRLNFSQGMDDKGNEMDMHTLARYATLAAAFLQVTTNELSTEHTTNELLPVVTELISIYSKELEAETETGDLSLFKDEVSGRLQYDSLYQEIQRVMKLAVISASSLGNDSLGKPIIAVSNAAAAPPGSAVSETVSTQPLPPSSTAATTMPDYLRKREMVRIVKDVASSLLCPPIGLRGVVPAEFVQNYPLEIGGNDRNVVNKETSMALSESSSMLVENVADTSTVVRAQSDLASNPSRYGETLHLEAETSSLQTSPLPDKLGFPSSVLAKMKVSHWCPGGIVRGNILQNALKKDAQAKSSESDVMNQFGVMSAETKWSKASSAKFNQSSQQQQRQQQEHQSRSQMDEKTQRLRCDDLSSVCLHAGSGYYAKKALIQRLVPLSDEENKVEFDHGEYVAAKTESKINQDGSSQLVNNNIPSHQLGISASTTVAVKENIPVSAVLSEPLCAYDVASALCFLSQAAAGDKNISSESISANASRTATPQLLQTEVGQSVHTNDFRSLEATVSDAVMTASSTTSPHPLRSAQPSPVVMNAVSSANDVNMMSIASSAAVDSSVLTPAVVVSGNAMHRLGIASESHDPTGRGKRVKVANILYQDSVLLMKSNSHLSQQASSFLEFITSRMNGGFARNLPYCMESDLTKNNKITGDSSSSDKVATEKRVTSLTSASLISPMRGWASQYDAQQQEVLTLHGTALPSVTYQWQHVRMCCFCRGLDEDHICGRMLSYSDGYFVHVNCLRWSIGVCEKQNTLLEAYAAREKATLNVCYFCRHKGATVGCANKKKKCHRMYHLKCALVCKCLLLECKAKDADVDSAHDIYTLTFCPEHASTACENVQLTRPWQPQDPNRCLLIEDNENIHSESISLALSHRRSGRVLRTGCLSILHIGLPRMDFVDFHNEKYIYPHHFKSARIFPSMLSPRTRTLYLFEILHETVDFETASEKEIQYLKNCLDRNIESDTAGVYPVGTINSPLFRVVTLDALDRPLFSKSVEQLLDIILTNVARCNAVPNCKQRLQRDSYGLTAHQFFGLGQSFTRRGIELLSESTAAMVAVKPVLQYLPSYKLPTESDARRIYLLQCQAKLSGAMSTHGCSRADGYSMGATRPVGVRITKILTKVTATNTENKNTSSSNDQQSSLLLRDENGDIIVNDARDRDHETRRENEYNRQRYLAMSAAYLQNPYMKLEVQKSRIHGWGLFARINFERNDIIVEYIGEKIRQVVADRRETMYEEQGVGSCYLFRLDKEDIVDATRCGGMARFMNHCCEPNATAKVISCENQIGVEEKHIVIIAARDIQVGEEVTYDYKFPTEEKKLKCYCGASMCQGSMN